MFITHARIVLTENLIHVWIDRQNIVSLVSSTRLAHQPKMVKFPSHRHVLSFDERDHIIRRMM